MSCSASYLRIGKAGVGGFAGRSVAWKEFRGVLCDWQKSRTRAAQRSPKGEQSLGEPGSASRTRVRPPQNTKHRSKERGYWGKPGRLEGRGEEGKEGEGESKRERASEPGLCVYLRLAGMWCEPQILESYNVTLPLNLSIKTTPFTECTCFLQDPEGRRHDNMDTKLHEGSVEVADNSQVAAPLWKSLPHS